MSYNGSGTFAINSTGQPVVAGTVISSTVFNSLTADLGTGLSTAITKDGQTTTTARILFAAGISSTLATDATSISTGSILTLGGLGVTKAAWIGGLMNVAGAATFQSTIGITGALTATTINASGLVAMAAAATVGTTLAVGGTATMAAINASGTVAMAGAATVGTTLGVSGTSTMAAINATVNADAPSGIVIQNSSTGTSAAGSLKLVNSNAGSVSYIGKQSTTRTTYANVVANSLSCYTDNAAGMSFLVDAAGPITFATNSALAMTIASGGAVTIPGTLGVTGVSTLTGGATIGTGSNVLGLKVGWLTATNTKTSSTALTTLSDLTIAIGAGETWLIEYVLIATAGLETTGLSLQVDTPASAVQDIFYEYIGERYDLVGGLYTTPKGVYFETASGTLVSWTAADIVFGGKAAINVFVRVTASGAGNVTLGYAQETSSGTALNILRGSRVKAQRTA